MPNNRELSQLGSYINVDDSNKTVGIVTNLTVSGVVSATSFSGTVSGNASSASFAPVAGVATHALNAYWEKTASGINTTSNIGIGTTVPTSTLTVVGDVRANTFIGTVSGNASSASFASVAGVATYAENGYWEKAASGINTTSNIGIGTTNPTSKLQVNGDIKISGTLIDANNTNYYFNPATGANITSGIYITNDPVSYGTYLNLNDDQIYAFSIITGRSIDLRVDSLSSYINAGNFGIGTANPSTKLHVIGDSTVSGLTNLNQITETVANAFNTTLAPSTETLTVDTSQGTVVLGDLNASVTTWAFTNVPTANSKATTITLIIDGDTAQTYGDACSVNGSAVSGGVKWSGGSAPTATNNFDIITFTIVKDSVGTINVFGSGTTDFS